MACLLNKPGRKFTRKKKRKPQFTVIEDVATNEMTHDELSQYIVKLRDELIRERDDRNFTQLERDKVETFAELGRDELKQTKIKSEINNAKNDFAIQKKENEIRDKDAELATSIMLLKKEFELQNRKEFSATLRHHSEMMNDIRVDKMNASDAIRKLILEYESELHTLRTNFHEQLETQQAKSQQQLDQLRTEMERERCNELREVEERSNDHIANLSKGQEKSLIDMKNYFNDIVVNNLAVIDSLKEKSSTLTKNNDALTKENKALTEQNQNLSQSLEQSTNENQKLKRFERDTESNKKALKIAESSLKTCMKDRKQLQRKYDIVEQQFKHLERERDELYDRFQSAIGDIQQKCGLKNLLLEKKLTALGETLDGKELELGAVAEGTGMDRDQVDGAARKTYDLMQSKNSTIKDLQYNLAQTSKINSELLSVCQNRLNQFGMRSDDLGIASLPKFQPNRGLGLGPSGLLSAPP